MGMQELNLYIPRIILELQSHHLYCLLLTFIISTPILKHYYFSKPTLVSFSGLSLGLKTCLIKNLLINLINLIPYLFCIVFKQILVCV